MAKYLLKVSYTVEGTKGLLKEGGSSRRAAAEQVVQSLGGNLDSFYFAFGEPDGYAIVDLPRCSREFGHASPLGLKLFSFL